MIEASGDTAIDKLASLLQRIYNYGKISTELSKSIFIKIAKKAGALDCKNHRTISLMSHVTSIITYHIKQIERQDQREGIKRTVLYCRRKRDKKCNVYIQEFNGKRNRNAEGHLCMFIDYSKAFDKVKHNDMVEI